MAMDAGVRKAALALAVVAAPLWGAGCEASAGGSGVLARDSAGVRIVESHGPAWAPGQGWRLGDAPDLQIGMLDGPQAYQFSSVAGAWRQEGGGIVVGDRTAAEIRFFGPDGAFVRSVGRLGDGPGEFRSLWTVSPYRGDSIVAWDRGAQRLTIFDGEGGFGRTSAVTDRSEPQGSGPAIIMMPALLLGAFADGSLAAIPSTALRVDPAAPEPPEISLVRYSAEGERIGALARFPGPQVQVFVGSGPRLPYPFQTTYTAATLGERLFLGTGQGYEIRVLSAAGTLERLIRAHHLDLTVGEEAREAYREWRRQVAAPENRDEVERALRDVRFPETLPPYAEILVDAREHVWARDYRLPGREGPERWSVFDPEGRLLGAVETPERLRVLQIGPDFVLGVWTDDLQVPYVRVYPLLGR